MCWLVGILLSGYTQPLVYITRAITRGLCVACLCRFTSMVLNVLSKIVGQRGLEIKVDNMESYNFNPKIILQEVTVGNKE